MQPRVNYLLNLGVKQEDVGKIITKHPQILEYRVEQTMQPKYEYLVRELHGSVTNIIDFPAYFGYSLEGRIKPRHEFLKTKGRTISISRMLAPSDENFAICIAKSTLEDYQRFKEKIRNLRKSA